MRYPATLLATFVLAACSTAPVTRVESPTASIDSVVDFLLAAAATDFHTHRPPDPVRFRDVRVGYLTTSSGEKRSMLCGQFLPAQADDKAEWIPFATIKTDPYEQWIGHPAVGLCSSASVIWEKRDDLSPLLQNRVDSLRSARGQL